MLVLDANILIRAILGKRVRYLLEKHAARGARFYAPEAAFVDAEKYLPALLTKRGKPTEHLPAAIAYLMPLLRSFVRETFGFKSKTDVSSYPELEDVFTMLDLSANSGHHLGVHFAPAELRQVRRMLLSRTIHMLHGAYFDGKEQSKPEREHLLEFVKKLSPKRHKFVSLNWDVVLEACLGEVEADFPFHYSPEIRPVTINEDDEVKPRRVDKDAKSLLIAKMHGSINWLYCDCCRWAYSVPVENVSRLGVQVLKRDEATELLERRCLPGWTVPIAEWI